MTHLQTMYGPLEATLRTDGSIYFYALEGEYLTVDKIPHRVHLNLNSPDADGRRRWAHDGFLGIQRMDRAPGTPSTDGCVKKIRAELERHAPHIDHPRRRLQAELLELQLQKAREDEARINLRAKLEACDARAQTLEERMQVLTDELRHTPEPLVFGAEIPNQGPVRVSHSSDLKSMFRP